MRRAPLSRKTPLARGKPLKAGKGLQRKSTQVSKRRSPYQHPEWRKLARAVRKRSGGICELCGVRPATGDPHHEAYAAGRGWRRLIVPMDQLVAVCRPCHLQQHPESR